MLLLLLGDALDLDGLLIAGRGEHVRQHGDLRPELIGSIDHWSLRKLVDLALEDVDDLPILLGDVLDLDGLLGVGHGERALQRIYLGPELSGAIESWPPRKLVDLPLERVDDLLLRFGDVANLGGLNVVGRG